MGNNSTICKKLCSGKQHLLRSGEAFDLGRVGGVFSYGAVGTPAQILFAILKHRSKTNGVMKQAQSNSIRSSDLAIDEDSSWIDADHDLHNRERLAVHVLAGRESKTTAFLRIVVLLFLLLFTIVLSYCGYTLPSVQQSKEFENAFRGYSEDLIKKFQASFLRYLQDLDALGTAITSHALHANQFFPFVTLPNFEVIAALTRIQSGAIYVDYSPLVQADALDDWNEYSWENRFQFLDPIKADAKQRMHQKRKCNSNCSVVDDGLQPFLSDIVFNQSHHTTSQFGKGPFLPIWQQSPAAPLANVFNFNKRSDPWSVNGLDEAMRTALVVLDRSHTIEELDNRTREYLQHQLSLSQFRNSCKNGGCLRGPLTPVSYPVFDSFDPQRRRVSGMLSTQFHWQPHFRHVLPRSAKGVYCVVSNRFNDTFAFLFDDKHTEYVGNDFQHDSRFEHLAKTANLETLNRHMSYTSVGLSPFTNYTITVYASQATKQQHTNSDPIRNAGVLVGIFVFVSVVFVSYDCAVSRQRKILMNRAVASGAIVSSLFPSQVREQLYQQEPSARGRQGVVARERHERLSGSSHVIAETFENTTIMFADLAGFTKWSSDRPAEEVFCLLETLFQAFDTIAVSRKVFKVETVGDCYIAVAGLPSPQPKHAVIMTIFAVEVLSEMTKVVSSLTHTLGAETESLELRIGLHSGPVTGGVVRGQKARFQLFGPTMNQASRMESTGIPGNIHVSSTTAEQLAQLGKNHWVTARREKVEAKGLGLLQTYWIVLEALEEPNQEARTALSENTLDPTEIASC